MPPRKRKAQDSASESELESEESASDYEEEDTPPPKKAPARKPAAKKAKAKESPAKKSPAGKSGEEVEPWVTEAESDESSLIYRANADAAPKIAAFDLDDTLVKTKSNAPFPTSEQDWKLKAPGVVTKLKELQGDGFKVVILTNQGGIGKDPLGLMGTKIKNRINNFLRASNLDLQVFACPAKPDKGNPHRKPGTGMWDRMVQDFNGGQPVSLEDSFYVGDAGGRANDHSDSDKEFAEAVGIKFHHADDYFPESDEPGDELNAGIIHTVNKCAEVHKKNKDFMRANALTKAAAALQEYTDEITMDDKKKVLALKGVGKGTWTIIEDYLTTGTTELLSSAPGEDTSRAPAPKSGAAAFM